MIVENFAHTLEQVLPKLTIPNVIVTSLGEMLGFPKRLIVNFVVRRIKKLVPAWHTNTAPGSAEHPFSAGYGTPLGTAAGLIIEIGGLTIYDAGDTCLFGDMELIGKRHGVDLALLPIGGHYTMDREDAVYAAGLIGAKQVMPIHFDTFPPIETDSAAFAADLTSKGIEPLVMEPGARATV